MFAGCVTAVLCATLLLVPGLIHWLFHLDSPSGTDVMSRRAAMLFLGLSVLVFRTRNAPPSPLRASVSLALGITMAGMLGLGIFDLTRGAVGWGILPALGVEAFFAAAYLRFWWVG